ncbi:MAG: septum formation initiator [Peptoniphilaceae bacterium]|nr:septum formation initiator [Peptoniphilaceae bacterium]MDY6018145.1 septum formation initiator [Anaerococcus sp.]
MAKNSALRIKPINNNKKRKRLRIRTTKEDRLKERAQVLRVKDRRFRRNLSILTLLSFVIMGAFLINAKKQLNETKLEYNKLDSQYISYELSRDRLKTKLEKTIDIKEIQRYAMEELGMIYENDDNTVYVNVNR